VFKNCFERFQRSGIFLNIRQIVFKLLWTFAKSSILTLGVVWHVFTRQADFKYVSNYGFDKTIYQNKEKSVMFEIHEKKSVLLSLA
jgi:hypothetical protein